MKFPKHETPDIILIALLEYCNDILIPLVIRKKGVVECISSKDMEFNAMAETKDCKTFKIIINDGVLITFIDAINRLENEIIQEEIEELSKILLKEPAKSSDIYRAIAYAATFFIILHELAHIFRGHFGYMIEKAICEFDNANFHFSEITQEWPKTDANFEDNFVKLVELDADASAMDILLTLSLELFAVVSDEITEQEKNWENHEWREATNKLMFYGASLGLALIETKRGRNEVYPYPFTRVLTIMDVYRYQKFKSNNLVGEYDPVINYVPVDQTVIDLQTELIFIYMQGIDIIVECSKIVGEDVSLVFGSEEEDIYHNLLTDFTHLNINLEPYALVTPEGQEFQRLRMLKPTFDRIFSPFLKQTF